MTMSLEETAQATTIRVVFDGAPFAGKTTAALSLGEALGGFVESPEEENGRTLWFDWMTYSAGHHEGRAIRVELVTVPGQVHLAARRRHLIAWGDVIVFIANTSEAVFADSVARFHDLRRELGASASKPVIVIANKRDLMDALPLADVCSQLGLDDDDVVIEGVATAGGGIRTAFIHAVRAAIEHSVDRLDATTADDLLADMQAALVEAEASAAAEAAGLPIRQAAPSTADDTSVTRVELATSGDVEPARPAPAALAPGAPVPAALAAGAPPPAALEPAASATPATPDDLDATTADEEPARADEVTDAADTDPTEPSEQTAEELAQLPPPPALANDHSDDEDDDMSRSLRLNRDAIADGEAVVVFAQHWRTIVDIALGSDQASCDPAAIAELADWGLLVDGEGPDVGLPSDDTDVPSPGPGVVPALAFPPATPAEPAGGETTTAAVDDGPSEPGQPVSPPLVAHRTVMF